MIFFQGSKMLNQIRERDNAKYKVSVNDNIATIINLEKFVRC